MLAAIKNDNLTEEAKEILKNFFDAIKKTHLTKKDFDKWKGELENIEGEKLEKEIFDGLKEYFQSNPDQQVLVIRSCHLLDLLGRIEENKEEKERDFIVINLTYGYVLNIEAKMSIKDKKTRHRYVYLSILMSPIAGIVR